ncbi:conserved protein of unknown function [Georgfuchsia toluolica]|uniref:Type II secretion system protein n=1 Tax=Georgfuchsia toluolica TaxID=424218 RepID=A0A916NAC1_9PROT|nr:hypothetical protein [Georgfuchsia toluolica]CAG4885207.1 conserved protein of unknown function [Georgfuchsia toluolica]
MADRRLAITSRFELAVIAVVAGIFLLAMLVTEAQSERLAMTLAIRNMRTGLQLAMAEKLMRGEDKSMGTLAETNPLELIGRPNGGSGAKGDWQFDARRHELVYRPLIPMAFEGRSELRWHIVGISGPGGGVTGLRLAEVAPAVAGQTK